jgi:hypothetical protein
MVQCVEARANAGQAWAHRNPRRNQWGGVVAPLHVPTARVEPSGWKSSARARWDGGYMPVVQAPLLRVARSTSLNLVSLSLALTGCSRLARAAHAKHRERNRVGNRRGEEEGGGGRGRGMGHT